ncbi:MAG: MBOAT family O-acyltransferase [Pseudomonadota bacterium]
MLTRTHFYCLICVLAIFSVSFFFASPPNVYIKADKKLIEKNSSFAHQEVSSVELFFHSRGYSEHINIRFNVRGFQPTVTIKNHHHLYLCALKSNGISECSVDFVFNGEAVSLTVDSGDVNKKFQMISINALKQKSLTPLNRETFNEILVLLIIILPVYWLTFSKIKFNQWLIVGLSVFILAKIQLTFTLVLIPFLYLSYFMGVSSNNYVKFMKKPVLFLTVSCIFLFIFKLFIVHSLFFDKTLNGLDFVVPLGISYFVIRLIDCQLKWYRGELKCVSFREFLLFIIFPPTLAAGPIDTLDRFIAGRVNRITTDSIFVGLSRIAFGVFQKFVIADYFLSSYLGDNFFLIPFDVSSGDDSGVFQLLFVSFIFVYVDFSAYSNIAIGLSRLFGYHICENFNWPLFSTSPRDFWKRWHMSLSGWCMRNIYFPLLIKTKSFVVPSFMVMFVVGMWHSISLSWFFWAVHHTVGILVTIIFERKFNIKISKLGKYAFLLRVLMIVCTLVFVAGGYAFAQYSDASVAVNMYLAYWRSIILFLFKFVPL